MKTKKRYLKKVSLVGVIFVVVVMVGLDIVFADPGSNPFDGYALNASYNFQIWAVADCQQVNNSGSVTYFVPTRTATEFNSFKSHLPSGVTTTSCTSYPPRIVLWTGKIAKHTNSSGVWVDDNDCTTSWPSSNTTYCAEWNSEAYSAVNFNMEWIFNWKTSGCVGSYESAKQTVTCKLCTNLNDISSCQASGSCYWHSYGPGCSVASFCYGSYSTQTDCENAGCYWNGYCYDGYECMELLSESECTTGVAYSEDPCGYDTMNGCCHGPAGICATWNGLYSQCIAQSCQYDQYDYCHEACN